MRPSWQIDRDGKVHGQMIGDRGKQRAEFARRRSGIRTRQIERQSVFKQAARAGQGEDAVAQSVVVELKPGESVRIAPQAGGDEVQRVFEIAALRLKMMRAEIHAFRPDGLGQQSS